jgi:hypothetical protein
MTSGAMTRSASSSNSWPVWSPCKTAMVAVIGDSVAARRRRSQPPLSL